MLLKKSFKYLGRKDVQIYPLLYLAPAEKLVQLKYIKIFPLIWKVLAFDREYNVNIFSLLKVLPV
jgi:hypothetical protein